MKTGMMIPKSLMLSPQHGSTSWEAKKAAAEEKEKEKQRQKRQKEQEEARRQKQKHEEEDWVSPSGDSIIKKGGFNDV